MDRKNEIPGKSVVRQFEARLSEYFDNHYVIAVSNATIGIMGVFMTLGITDSEVLSTPLTWPGSFSGIKLLSNNIKYCDIEEPTLTISPESIENKITKGTKAVLTSDFLGYPCRLDEIKTICDKNDIWLIHDAASSLGSIYKDKYSGYFSDVTIFSFGPNKPFTTGEGGAVITQSKEIYEQLVYHLTHPNFQSLVIEDINMFSLNTNINLLAAEFGLKTFNLQISMIKEKQNKIHNSKLVRKKNFFFYNTVPNYYKVLVNKEIVQNNSITLTELPEELFIDNNTELKKITEKYGITTNYL